MAEILAPIRAVGELRRRAEQRPALCGKRRQPLDERIPVRFVAERRQAHAAPSRSASRRPLRPPPRAPPGEARTAGSPSRSGLPRNPPRPPHPPTKSAALAWPRKAFDLTRGSRAAVGVTRPAGRRMAGDAAAPRIGGLPGAAIRVRQRIVRRHVHHDERIERHLQPARLQGTDRRDHRAVRRRAAIGGRAAAAADQRRRRLVEPGGRPALRQARLPPAASPPAGSGSVRPCRSSPNQETTSATRRSRGHSACSSSSEAARSVARMQHVPVDRAGVARHGLRVTSVRRQAVLRRAGDQRHRLQRRRDRAHRPHHLELQLRDAVAVVADRHPLDHRIGGSAIGRRAALPRGDQRVGQLALSALVDPHLDRVAVELAAVGPDPPHPGDRPLRKCEGGIGEIAVLRRLASRRRPCRLAAAWSLPPRSASPRSACRQPSSFRRPVAARRLPRPRRAAGPLSRGPSTRRVGDSSARSIR